MIPFVGQIVQYRYKPESAPIAAIVAQVHDPEWVALYAFHETPRWVPHVEFGVHCREAKPKPIPEPPNDFYDHVLGCPP